MGLHMHTWGAMHGSCCMRHVRMHNYVTLTSMINTDWLLLCC